MTPIENDDAASHGSNKSALDTISPKVRPNRFTGVANLIQSNRRLQVLYIDSPEQNRSTYLRSLAPLTLDAIRSHPSLTKIKVNRYMTCLLFARLINHLPQQLQVLDVNAPTFRVAANDPCSVDSRLFKSDDSLLSLRRLNFSTVECFSIQLLTQLLKRCPDLEDLDLPFGSHYSATELEQLLDSDCKRLASLGVYHHCPICHPLDDVRTLLQRFSRGFKELRLRNLFNMDCLHDFIPPIWERTVVLETLLATATVNTIEVLSFSEEFDNDDHIVGILKHCPQLREFRVKNLSGHYEGLKASDLLLSMEEPWRCQETLEVLQLKVRRLRRCSDSDMGEISHDIDIQQLHLRLDSFPKLVDRLLE